MWITAGVVGLSITRTFLMLARPVNPLRRIYWGNERKNGAWKLMGDD